MNLAIIKDDDAIDVVVRYAQQAGFSAAEIRTARNREEALALFAELLPDIAVIDPHLTDDEDLEDGIEVIWTLREKTQNCIIICLTSGGTVQLGVRALNAGANDHIDMSWPSVNWCCLLRERLKLWKGYLSEQSIPSQND